jgi:coenzyme F420 hydrogenase subunit beta
MSLAYVGLPCQLEGLRKTDVLSVNLKQDWPDKVSLYVGLLCRENWAYTCFRALIEDDYSIKLEDVLKFDIKKKKIVALKRDGEKIEFPLEESRPYVRAGCQVCLDFSCELADISIGAVGSPKKWSTVIVRTKKGMEILRGAEKEGYIQVKPIGEVKPGSWLIKKLSEEKREGALTEAERRRDEGISVSYISSLEKPLGDLVKDAEGKGYEELEYEVIDTGLCSACGACVAVCPSEGLKMVEERPVLLENCGPEGCNACYLACPRVSLPMKELKKRIFKDGQSFEEGIGDYLGIYAARARDPEILEKGQDGGAVTALLSYALDKKIVKGVLSVKPGDKPWMPVPAISRSSAELLKTSGTFYSYATTIPAVKGDRD